MPTTSRIPAVKAALVSTFTDSMSTATVFYGRWLRVPDGDYLTVGWTPQGDRTTGSQTWASLGNRARDEQIDVPCYVDSWSGSTDVAARVDAAYALLADAENTIRSDPTLGGVVPQPGWAQIGTYSEVEEENEAGLFIGITFHVLVAARI